MRFVLSGIQVGALSACTSLPAPTVKPQTTLLIHGGPDR